MLLYSQFYPPTITTTWADERNSMTDVRDTNSNVSAKAVDVQRKSIEDEVSKRVQQVLKNMGVNATA